MNKILAVTVLAVSFLLMNATEPVDKIHWLSWQEAAKLQKESPKKIFIDVYTNWCGWCKKMDASTFRNPEVVKYMNKHFYAIKMDAEMKDEIRFKDHTFKWVKAGRRGVHTLAYSLLEGKMSYPSFVTLNENYDRIAVSPGFKQPEQLLKELRFAGEERYKEMSWNDYNED
jgi:thioredoxin-related protein